MDHTNTRKSSSKADKVFKINGAVTTIEISASTYDALSAKKPLCEHVTKSCVNVADQVWDTFLREVAPQVKAAELIAEDNARQSCIGNISDCFQKACKDNMDPNDPDGSYDLCLTRPESMMNLCKVPLNACGIDEKSAEQSDVWDFVVARLAAMRVDACTTEVKKCLTNDDRCGTDFSNCIGLDTDTIMRMCPYDKLVACQNKYGENNIQGQDVYDEIANMVTGVFLNIDNAFLSQCQNAAEQAMIKVCGDTQNCDSLVVDSGAGSRSFKYQVCQYTDITADKITWNGVCRDSLDAISEQELTNLPEGVKGWAGKLSGTMYWGDISYSCDDSTAAEGDGNVSGETPIECSFTSEEEYIAALENAGQVVDAESKEIISDRVYGMEIRALEKAVNMAINAIESDPTVQFCMTGREVQGMKTGDGENKTRTRIGEKSTEAARFPNLTLQMRQTIATSALKNARSNYNKKYDEELQRMMKDQVKAAERVDRQAAVEVARNVCENWAEQSALPESKAPKISNAGRWIAVGLIVAAAAVTAVFTAGASGALAAVGIAAILGGTAASAGVAISTTTNALGKAGVEQWNYKQNIVTMFNEQTGVCTKITTTQNCAKVKKNYCEKWEDAVETQEQVSLISDVTQK